MTKFKYKDKIFETPNLEKKLKRLKITLLDIEILELEVLKVGVEDNIPVWKANGYTKYTYRNKNTGYLLMTIRENEELEDEWVLVKIEK